MKEQGTSFRIRERVGESDAPLDILAKGFGRRELKKNQPRLSFIATSSGTLGSRPQPSTRAISMKICVFSQPDPLIYSVGPVCRFLRFKISVEGRWRSCCEHV